MLHAYYMPNLGRAKIQHFGYKIKYFGKLFTPAQEKTDKKAARS